MEIKFKLNIVLQHLGLAKSVNGHLRSDTSDAFNSQKCPLRCPWCREGKYFIQLTLIYEQNANTMHLLQVCQHAIIDKARTSSADRP